MVLKLIYCLTIFNMLKLLQIRIINELRVTLKKTKYKRLRIVYNTIRVL